MDAADWDERYASSDLVWSSTPNQFVVEYLSDLPVGTMLDLAGGEGRNALWFADRGWRAEVADFSSVALERFSAIAERENLTDRCAATRVDATSPTAYAFAPFDLVVVAYLQIPAPDLAAALRGAADALSDHGTFFGVWHARENLNEGWGGPQNPAVLPSRDELRAAALDAGLEISALELRDRLVVTDSGEKRAVDVVTLARRIS